VFVLFEDFYTIGKDKDINFEDAVDYAINYADVHTRCTCPSQLYWGFSYEGTQLGYLYGVPRENRFPKIRNPNLRSTSCKHTDKVIEWILRHKDIVTKLFATYYNRLDDGQSIYAVNTKGTTITIGKKNEDGDVFFEQQVEEENMSEDQTPEEQTEETVTEETSEDVDKDGKTSLVTLKQSFKYSFKNGAFIYWMFTAFIMTIGLQLFLGGINEVFSSTGLNMTVVMASSFAPVPLTIMVYNKLISIIKYN
jgi:hypothetical protein